MVLRVIADCQSWSDLCRDFTSEIIHLVFIRILSEDTRLINCIS